jgi:hypothetical protein
MDICGWRSKITIEKLWVRKLKRSIRYCSSIRAKDQTLGAPSLRRRFIPLGQYQVSSASLWSFRPASLWSRGVFLYYFGNCYCTFFTTAESIGNVLPLAECGDFRVPCARFFDTRTGAILTSERVGHEAKRAFAPGGRSKQTQC